MEYKVKPTTYNHHKFRSRLEARWAVYFDAIGLEWEYEKEGFVLEDGESYLPDFWFPQVKMWAEVKPEKLSRAELKKCWYLVKGSGYPCILLEGQPDNKPYLLIPVALQVDGVDILDIKFENFGRKQMYDCIVSMYHSYPTSEHRFYVMTGKEDGEKLDDDEAEGYGTKDAVEYAKTYQFEYANSRQSALGKD